MTSIEIREELLKAVKMAGLDTERRSIITSLIFDLELQSWKEGQINGVQTVKDVYKIK